MIVYVIIVTFNGMQWIERCLKSVLDSSVPVHIIVVDNGSSDDTPGYIKENFPDILFMQNKSNLGFGRANNLGIEYALRNECDYVYLLNQDAWIEAKTIEILVNLAEKYSEYGIVSPLHVNSQKMALDTNFQCCISNSVYISDLVLRGTFSEIYECDVVNAAHWLITRKCLTTVGLFSLIFPHYGEDNNYIHRVKYHDLKIGFTPLSKCVHAREGRKESVEKIIYMNYINFLIRTSNINKHNHYFFSSVLFWGVSVYYLLKYRNLVSLKYIFKPITQFISIMRSNKKSKLGAARPPPAPPHKNEGYSYKQ
jgi:GT2 family glycosyltransferase